MKRFDELNKIDGVIALQEILGAKAMEYCKQYKGTDKYNVAMEAITFGYGLAEIEHILYKHTEDLLAGYRGTLEDWMKENRSGLDLDELEKKLDKALSMETRESLNQWMKSVGEKQSKAIKPTDTEKNKIKQHITSFLNQYGDNIPTKMMLNDVDDWIKENC